MSTRRTYILLSDALRDARELCALYADDTEAGVHIAARHIADALARQSTAFDRERFLKDAGVT